MSWSVRFSEPIPLPGGGELSTLEDARALLNRLRGYESNSVEWQTAVTAVLMVADSKAPIEIARAALVHALYPQGEMK